MSKMDKKDVYKNLEGYKWNMVKIIVYITRKYGRIIMKKSLKGSKTLVNLMKSFAGESQASMRYKYYAKQAEKEKYIQIRDIFLETSRNEDQHAKRFYRFLNQQSDAETVEITDSFPVHLDEKDTYTNLIAAAEGEHHETSSM